MYFTTKQPHKCRFVKDWEFLLLSRKRSDPFLSHCHTIYLSFSDVKNYHQARMVPDCSL